MIVVYEHQSQALEGSATDLAFGKTTPCDGETESASGKCCMDAGGVPVVPVADTKVHTREPQLVKPLVAHHCRIEEGQRGRSFA